MSNPSNVLRLDWDDIWFTVVVEFHPAYFDFRTYRIRGAYDVGSNERLYETAGGDFGAGDTETDIAKAQVSLSGAIKWDGCANVKFDEQDHVMLHFCGRRAWRNTAELMERLYDLAWERFPNGRDLIGGRK